MENKRETAQFALNERELIDIYIAKLNVISMPDHFLFERADADSVIEVANHIILLMNEFKMKYQSFREEEEETEKENK